MRQGQSAWEHGSLIIAVVSLAGAAGCGTVRPTPAAPSGKGWMTYAQGFHEFTYSQSTTQSGNTRTTTTTTTSGFQNVSHHEKQSADDVHRTLLVGRNVSDFKFNEQLAKDPAR